MSLIIALILGFVFGSLGAYFRGKFPDKISNLILSVIQAVPDFFLGLLLIYFLFFKLQLVNSFWTPGRWNRSARIGRPRRKKPIPPATVRPKVDSVHASMIGTLSRIHPDHNDSFSDAISVDSRSSRRPVIGARRENVADGHRQRHSRFIF